MSEPSAMKKSKKRPDGVDLERYKNLEKWSYRKWAWEFLRRNEEFIVACKSTDSGSDQDKLEVANNFGLKSYKRYSESYKGGTGRPKFLIGSISSWSNLDREDENNKINIQLNPGQILIRFDLAASIKDKKILQKQIRLATKRIHKRIATYENNINEASKVHKFKAMNFGISLRLLDHLAVKKTPLECAKLIFPKQGEVKTENELIWAVKDPIKSAKNMTREGYLYLSVLEGRPNGKGIPLDL